MCDLKLLRGAANQTIQQAGEPLWGLGNLCLIRIVFVELAPELEPELELELEPEPEPEREHEPELEPDLSLSLSVS